MKKKSKPSELFKISVTYDDVTPESAENGDFDESGFEVEPHRASLRDVLDLIETNYVHENFDPRALSQSLYSEPSTVCYREGRDRTMGVHIEGPARAMKRLNKILKEVL